MNINEILLRRLNNFYIKGNFYKFEFVYKYNYYCEDVREICLFKQNNDYIRASNTFIINNKVRLASGIFGQNISLELFNKHCGTHIISHIEFNSYNDEKIDFKWVINEFNKENYKYIKLWNLT